MTRGSCWTHSIAASGRPDAWRCAIGNRIEDPCFEIAGSLALLCGANPAAPASAHPVLLALTQPLPQEIVPAAARSRPWLVELAGGSLCRPFTGTRPVAANGMAGAYACQHGGIIFGPLQASASAPWAARVGTLAPAASGLPRVKALHTVAIQSVWK